MKPKPHSMDKNIMVIQESELKKGKLPINKIVWGDAFKTLKKFPDNSVDCIITSPPYWGQRFYGNEAVTIWDENRECKHDFKFEEKKDPMDRYGSGDHNNKDKKVKAPTWKMNTYKVGFCSKCNAWMGQLGLEPHPKLFIKHICDIVEECMRVLREEGNMFLNIGDTWATATSKGGYDRLNQQKNIVMDEGHRIDIRAKLNKSGENWLKEKQKLFIPYRIAIELQNRGYIVREDIIWTKKITKFPEKETLGCCMPFPILDKFLPAHEVILHIMKRKKVKAFVDRIKCKLKNSTFKRVKYPVSSTFSGQDERNPYISQKGMGNYFKKLNGAGKVINGKNWNVTIESELKGANPTSCIMFKYGNQNKLDNILHFAKFPMSLPQLFIEGFTDIGDIVLDPFLGSGTTGIVALKSNRKFIGIEISLDYCKIAEKRIKPHLEQKKLNTY